MQITPTEREQISKALLAIIDKIEILEKRLLATEEAILILIKKNEDSKIIML